MNIDVVVPATRSPDLLLESLRRQERPPDVVTIVSNELKPRKVDGLRVRYLFFRSDVYCFGEKDLTLRRNLGIWFSEADAVILQDDDLIAPANMVSSSELLLATEDLVWGHHRYIDFRAHSLEELLTLDPEAGRPREDPPNHLHGHWSCYGGMLAAHRDDLMKLGGFDMLFLGRQASEDQNLGFRWLRARGREKAFIWEPPFSWHPTEMVPWGKLVTNSCGDHKFFKSGDFMRCRRCPYRKPASSADLFREAVVQSFDPSLVEVRVEEI